MIKVIIADDHPIVRAGLKQIIMEDPDITVADEASNGAELLSYVRDQTYDVVLLDLTMPGMDGLETAAAIRGLGGPLSVRRPEIMTGAKVNG